MINLSKGVILDCLDCCEISNLLIRLSHISRICLHNTGNEKIEHYNKLLFEQLELMELTLEKLEQAHMCHTTTIGQVEEAEAIVMVRKLNQAIKDRL